MVWIILFAVLGALLGIAIALDDGDWMMMFIFGPLFGLGFGLMGALLAMMIGLVFANGTYKIENKIALQNLVDNTHTEGRFFLGSGTIEGVPHYSWYEQTDRNSFERRDARASEATVHYLMNGETRPYYIATTKVDKHENWGTWHINPGDGELIEHYDFYIPKGSITNEYKLDAK